MNIMIASDIHGSAFYCQAMMKAFTREEPDKILLLGDILYHGPRNDLPKDYAPKEVSRMLNGIKSKVMCVRGNCDSEVDQMMLEFPIMAEYCLLYAGNKMIFATHGHVFNTKKLPAISEGDILLHGHTHIPAWESFGNGNIYVNPGSVSIPKNDSNHSYITLTDEGIFWKDLDGRIYHTLSFED